MISLATKRGRYTPRFVHRCRRCSCDPHRRRHTARRSFCSATSPVAFGRSPRTSSRATSITYRRQYAATPPSSAACAAGNSSSTSSRAALLGSKGGGALHVVSRPCSRGTRRCAGFKLFFAPPLSVDQMLPIRMPARPCRRRSLDDVMNSCGCACVVLIHASVVLGSMNPQCGESSISGHTHSDEKRAITRDSWLLLYASIPDWHLTPGKPHTRDAVAP